MTDRRHILVSLDDAKLIARTLRLVALFKPSLLPVILRFEAETGGDFAEIVDRLKKTPICMACNHEGVPHACRSLETQKIGRRLARLLERAGG